MAVSAFKKRRGTQGTFTNTRGHSQIPVAEWCGQTDICTKKKQQNGVKNSKFWPKNPVYSPYTVPIEPETHFFVFPDLKIGGGGP